jgi:hypothetical protein
MRQLLLSALATIFFLMLAVLPARACLNDREIIQAEREFKSNYQEPKETPTPTPEYQELVNRDWWLFWGTSGTGGFLMLGAAVVGFVRFNRS